MSEQYEYLVRGALLQCSCGSFPRRLNLPLCHGVYIGKNPVMNSGDFIPEVNIMSFGTCSKTDSKCTPRFAGDGPWLNVNRRLIIGDEENYALTTQSYLECVTGGRITVVTSGQEYEIMDKDCVISKDEKFSSKEESTKKLGEDKPIFYNNSMQWIEEPDKKSYALANVGWKNIWGLINDSNISLFKREDLKNDESMRYKIPEDDYNYKTKRTIGIGVDESDNNKFKVFDIGKGIDLDVAEVRFDFGNENNNLNIEMDVASAEASLESAMKISNKGLDFYASAEAEAALYSAKVIGETTIWKFNIQGEAQGIAGGYAAGAEGGIKNNRLFLGLKFAAGYGGKVGVSIGLSDEKN